MKTRGIVFFIIWLCMGASYAQPVFYISDHESNDPLAQAYIQIFNTSGLIQETGVTNKLGNWTPKQQLTYPAVVVIQFLGYKNFVDTLNQRVAKISYALLPEAEYLEEAVVTGQITPVDPTQTVQKVRVIKAEQIENMAAVNLKDVLSNQLNMRISNDNATGSSGLSLMGIGGQNVKILIDGVPVIGRVLDQVDLTQINLNDIERIEIIEGPMSVNYGTNALAGAINIITKKNLKKSHSLQLNSYYETLGQYNFTINGSKRIKNNAVSFSGGRNFFNGWNNSGFVRGWDWLPKEQYLGRLGFKGKHKRLEYGYRLEGIYETIWDRGEPVGEKGFDNRFITRRLDNALNLNYRMKEGRNFNVIVAYNYYERVKNRYVKNLVTLDEQLVSEVGQQDTAIFTSIISRATYNGHTKNKKWGYQIGYDINIDQGGGGRVSDSLNQLQTDLAAFFSLEYSPVKRMTIKPGFRVAYNNIYPSPLVPSLQWKYRLKSGWDVRASYGKGFRAPGLKELYLDFVDDNHQVFGNPNLKPEKSHNFQASMGKSYSNPKSSLKPELSFFYNDITDRISLLTSSATEASYFNISRFHSLGGNLTVKFSSKNTELGIGYGHRGVSNNLGLQNLAFTPEVNIQLQQKLVSHLRINVFAKWNGKRQLFYEDPETGNPILTYTESYTLLDANLASDWFNKRLMLSFGVKNALGVTNIMSNLTGESAHSGGGGSISIGAGRVYFIKLTLKPFK